MPPFRPGSSRRRPGLRVSPACGRPLTLQDGGAREKHTLLVSSTAQHEIPGRRSSRRPGGDIAETTTLYLVDRVKRGDQEALAVLMERFLPRLQRWASGRLPGGVRDLADTSDLVQDVLLQSFRKMRARISAERGRCRRTCGRPSSIGSATSSEKRGGGQTLRSSSPLRPPMAPRRSRPRSDVRRSIGTRRCWPPCDQAIARRSSRASSLDSRMTRLPSCSANQLPTPRAWPWSGRSRG